jgi:carboxylesterase type B
MQSAGQASVGNAAANYAEVMKHFGCTDLACIRAVNGTAIQSYVDANNLLFGPVEDETCMGDKTLASIVSGQFARVPTFIGTNANEIRLISAAFDKGVDSETSFFQKFGIDLDLDGKLLANVYGGIPGDWPLEVMDQ